MKKIIVIISLTIFSTSAIHSQINVRQKAPPKEMTNLEFLIGKWRNSSDQWFDSNGKPIEVIRGKKAQSQKKKKVPYEIQPIMEGLYLEGGASGDFVRAYFYFNDVEKKYYHLAIDFMGATSIMTGDFDEDVLVLTDILPQTNPKGGTIMWRRKLSKIDDGFLSVYEYSSDNGQTWKMRGKQTMKRVTSIEAGLKEIATNPLQNLIGNWKSSLDKKYKDHPVIKKVNPELKGHIISFKWGASKEVLRLSIYNLDRPSKGDTIKFIDGIIVPDNTLRALKMIEYNVDSDIYFDGTYSFDKSGNITRNYTASFDNGSSAKFREKWIWQNENKTHFKWYTERFENDKFIDTGIVVDYYKIE